MNISPLKIGNITIKVPILLAPMAGYTDRAFRSLCCKFHCGMVFTEVVNARGIIHGSLPTLHLLETAPEEKPISAHIYGSDPETMSKAAVMIEKLNRFDSVDINCGCPVRKIVAKGAGSALMNNPDKIKAIVNMIRQSISLPVTVKTRIGSSPSIKNISEIAQAVEEGGACAIFIHARFASNSHKGEADWQTLAEIKSERSIPVIGNGGISSASDAIAMLTQTGVDGVMIGRAAVGNPWIFQEIYSFLTGIPYSAHTMAEHKEIIFEHLNNLIQLKEKAYIFKRHKKILPDQSAILHFRAHLFKYLSGMKGWSEIKRNFQTMHTMEDVTKAVNQVIV